MSRAPLQLAPRHAGVLPPTRVEADSLGGAFWVAIVFWIFQVLLIVWLIRITAQNMKSRSLIFWAWWWDLGRSDVNLPKTVMHVCTCALASERASERWASFAWPTNQFPYVYDYLESLLSSRANARRSVIRQKSKLFMALTTRERDKSHHLSLNTFRLGFPSKQYSLKFHRWF